MRHIALLFYSDTIAMRTSTSAIKGRAIANHGFLRALIRHSSIEKLTIIVTSALEKDLISDNFPEIFNRPGLRVISLMEAGSRFMADPPDIIHILGPDLYRGFHLRSTFAQAPCAVTGMTHSLSHSAFPSWMYLNLLYGPKSYDKLVCTTSTAADVIQKIADHARRSLNSSASLNTTIIPLGIDFASLSKKVPHGRMHCHCHDSNFILLTMGRFSHDSKVDLLPLLAILRQVKAKIPQTVLVMAGADNDPADQQIIRLAAAEHGLSDSIRIITNPTETIRQSLYHSADVFLALSDNLQETFGLTLLEAMAAGLPVIASDWDGYRSIVTEGETGHLIQTWGMANSPRLEAMAPLLSDGQRHLIFAQATATDIAQTTAKICSLGSDSNKLLSMGRIAQQRASTYDWARIVDAYQKLWQQLRTQANVVESSPDFLTPSLSHLEIFSSYPTVHIRPNDRIRLTPEGRLAMRGEYPLRLYAIMEEIIKIPLISTIAQLADTETTAEIVASINRELPAEIIIYHILWMAKYGLVSIHKPG